MAKVKLGNVKGSKGDKGDRGSLWRVSDKMTGQGTSGTAFPGAGFEDSVVNDICLNPATFDLYRCQTAGNAAAAKWVWECNIKGAPGPKGDKGDPTTVDAVLSESSANPIQNKAVATKFKDVQDSLGRVVKADVLYSGSTESSFTLSGSAANYRVLVLQMSGYDGVVAESMPVISPNGKTVDLSNAFYTGDGYRYFRLRCTISGASVSVVLNDRFDAGSGAMYHDLKITGVVGLAW